MTQPVTLKRIETALRDVDTAELRWAAAACKYRLRFVTNKHGGGRRWRSLLARIEAMLLQNTGDASDNPMLPSLVSIRERSERQRAGRPTNLVVCKLRLPRLDVDRSEWFSSRQMSGLRRFVRDWVPETEAGREGGSFTVSAVVRHRANQGTRRVVLCRWRAGQDVNAALERAADQWAALQKSLVCPHGRPQEASSAGYETRL